MPPVKIPARDIILQVLAADGTTWLTTNGLNSVTANPGENEEKTETTTYDSDGNYEEVKMQVGASLACEGFLLKDNVTGVQDSGQQRCEVLHAQVGTSSLGSVRFRHPVDTVWKRWPAATFSLGEQGGGNNDMTGWSCNITRSGASTTEAV